MNFCLRPRETKSLIAEKADHPYRILIIVGSGSGKQTHCLI